MKEHEKARAWREKHGLSREALGGAIGYSKESIYWFEQGICPPRGPKRKQEPFPEWVWLRYKRACEGYQAEVDGGKFKW